MTEEVLIDVSHVSKCYKVASSTISKVINAFIPAYQRGVSDFWALKDVSIQVKRGEAVAIIGRNGSGKSTLLEIITGTRKPTSGEVNIKGRVAALLQLGSGFNPEFTGRENIILNGLLLGLSRQEMEAKFDEIIDFADIGEFIEQPVKNYSSGMLVRLAFSVQVALEPDILIIDEALSVGDFFFKQKCTTRMRELREAGTTILFVSHSMANVREICDRAIVLRYGDLVFTGESNQAIRYYLSHGKDTDTKKISYENIELGLHHEWLDIVQSEENMLWQHESIDSVLQMGGLLGVAIKCDEDEEPLIALIGEKRTFRVYFKTMQSTPVTIELSFSNKYGKRIYATQSAGLGFEPFESKQTGIICFDLKVTLLFSQGGYSFNIIMNSPDEDSPTSRDEIVMQAAKLGPIIIKRDQEAPLPFKGNIGLPIETNIEIIN